MPHAHDLGLGLELGFNIGADLVECADFAEHAQRLLVRPAVQGTGQGADGRRHHGIRVGQGRADHQAAEGRGVHGVLGVQNQTHVHDVGFQRVGLFFGQHPHEVGRMGQVIARFDRLVAVTHALKGGHNRRHLGDQTHNRPVVLLLVGHVFCRVEHAQGRHHRLQSVHGMAVFRERFEQIDDPILDPPMGAEVVIEILQLLARGQLSPQQQVRHFLVGAFFRQFLNRNAAVFEDALLSVDKANLRFHNGHTFEPGHKFIHISAFLA